MRGEKANSITTSGAPMVVSGIAITISGCNIFSFHRLFWAPLALVVAGCLVCAWGGAIIGANHKWFIVEGAKDEEQEQALGAK